jgi:TRAP-type C4-dicarboxylate transport system substrate-binding protein
MVKIKQFLRLGALATLSVAIAVPVAAETTLKASAALSKGREQTQSYIKHFLNAINADGKGIVKTRYIGGPEVTPPRKQAAALKRGTFDITMSPASYYIGMVPEGYAILVSTKNAKGLRASGGFDLLDQAHQKKANAKLLAWGESEGAFNTYLAKKPAMNGGQVNLKGFKMRSTATYRPLFEFLGGTPVGMKSSEIYTGLQRGVIQGFGSPSSGLVRIGVAGMVKYRVDPSYYRLNNLVIMNLDKWKGLSRKAQQLLQAKALTYETESSKFYLSLAAADEKQMKAKGMQIISLKGAAATDYVNAANSAVWKKFGKLVGAESAAKFRAKFAN